MNEKAELTLSINQANSLKRITKMPGWKIIEDFLDKYEQDSLTDLKDMEIFDMENVQACRKILKFIKDFREMLRFTEISAYEDEKELKRIKGEEKNDK